MNEVILGLILYLCQHEQSCINQLDECTTKKYWEHYDYAVNRAFPDQQLLDFVYDCQSELNIGGPQ